jgi:molybdenum cofactor guanylyltransferase
MSKLPAYILAGGRSLRFEDDKSLVSIQGRLQIQRLMEQLERRHTVQVVADRADRFSHLGIGCLVDAFPDLGPISGILAALRDGRNHNSQWALITGCDQLLWKDEWDEAIRPLLEKPRHLQDYELIVWQSGDTFSPLPGFFHTCLVEPLEELCRGQKIALKNLARSPALRVYYQPIEEHPRDFSFNTPLQLQQLLERKELR